MSAQHILSLLRATAATGLSTVCAQFPRPPSPARPSVVSAYSAVAPTGHESPCPWWWTQRLDTRAALAKPGVRRRGNSHAMKRAGVIPGPPAPTRPHHNSRRKEKAYAKGTRNTLRRDRCDQRVWILPDCRCAAAAGAEYV